MSYRPGDGYRLGAWVASQRSMYGSGGLTAERQRRLEELLGWKWSVYRARE
jgi:hypothetical protein